MIPPAVFVPPVLASCQICGKRLILLGGVAALPGSLNARGRKVSRHLTIAQAQFVMSLGRTFNPVAGSRILARRFEQQETVA